MLDQKDGKNTAILTYGYDPLRRVTSETDALGNVTSFTYDGAGDRLTKTGSRRQLRRHAKDRLHELHL